MPDFVPSDAQQKLIREAQERARLNAAFGRPVPDELVRRMQAEAAVEAAGQVNQPQARAPERSLIQRVKAWLLGR
ncbi:hypothetical protein [Roseateles noduli]|uniref:hypothetical protein n=1 Tax=Roseateles noduli TaxID=2052484 RepID=UPI003D65E416